ncbi:MAG: electron transfer flavoprotein subunit beta/FixA family protein [Chloroflexi bacterium]|nr:electron transfer flavoprotein subunit beta/FixA family protein [Chloroflexota bacterium]
MHIVVCVKQVPDPETPASAFKIQDNKVVPAAGVPPVVDGFGEQAVEAALRIRDVAKDPVKITVVSVGKDFVMDVIKKPLSMGADDLVLLQDPAFDNLDSFATVEVLTAAIKKLGAFDLVLCGRQASDWDMGVVAYGLAERLGASCVSIAKDVKAADGKVEVERVLTDGFEKVEAPLPAVVSVSNELGEARYPTLKGIMAAGRKKPTVWTAQDLGVEAKSAARVNLQKLFIPVKEAKCEFVKGENGADAGRLLALKLREAKLL